MSISYGVKSIIKENGYKIIDSLYLNSVLLADGEATEQFEKYKKYRLLSNDVDFYWGTKGFDLVTLLISYKGTTLVKYEKPSFVLVIDYLNKFDSLSKKEIEKMVNDAQEATKTQLESEIDALKVNKEKLLVQISILKQIEEKKEELKLLLTKLND